SHVGGDICPGDVNGSVLPCKEFKAWVSLGFPLFTDGIAGTIVNISPLGVIRGWALDPQNQNAPIQVFVYANGPVGQGQLVTQILANEAGDGIFNGHFFTVTLPA